MNRAMNKTLAVLGGIGAGAAVMYFLDPDRGARRRALVRDKAVGLKNDASYAIAGKAKDLRNRAQGLAHEAKGLLSHSKENEFMDQGSEREEPGNNMTRDNMGIA